MSLRTKVMQGGVFLAMRQGLGMVIGLSGVLLLTRKIGPESYGIYSAAFGMFWYLQILCQLGIEVFIVRQEGEDRPEIYHQAFTLLLLLSLGGVAVSQFGMPLLQHWIGLPGFEPVARSMFLSLPLVLLLQVPLAKLERQLDYRRVASIELANQFLFYLVALIFAFQGKGVWAPLIAWWCQQVQATLLFFWFSGYRPQFCWNGALAKQMLTYSIGYSASSWIWQARSLVNPLLIGRFAGAEAVAYVALAIRLVDVLSFVRAATWRIAIAALAQFQSDKRRLVNAVTEGMGLQILALGPLLVTFAIVSPWLIPLLFGEKWLPVVALFPAIALGSLTNALFNMHCSTLYVLKRNWDVTAFHIIHIVLFAGSTALLLPHFGMNAYGWGEMIALASYGIVHVYLAGQVGSPNYALPLLWWGAFGAALFVHQVGWWISLGIVAVALLPDTHHTLNGYIKSVRGKVLNSN
jgi:O-antigen/teichoic acid export membrane protein